MVVGLVRAQDDSQDSGLSLDHGSFRDRNARIFYSGGNVYRALSSNAQKQFQALVPTKFFQAGLQSGTIVQTKQVDNTEIPVEIRDQSWAGVLKHQRLDFISYPYEWCFGMLKDAALLNLSLLADALNEGFILKDSSAFNIQWQGAKPIFIDIPSFELWQAGEPWIGYQQFCRMFLFPLMLQAYKHVPFQNWLRANIDGVEVEDFANLMSFRDMFRPGVFKHVYLQKIFQSSYSSTEKDLKKELKDVGFHSELIKANVKGLTKLVKKLNIRGNATTWSDYTKNHSYTDSDLALKEQFVQNAVNARPRHITWDIGANTGNFSRIAARNSELVVAMDMDQGAVERMYAQLKSEANAKILPLVMNLANPSPSQGWKGLERRSLGQRGEPTLILALALIHHAVISANIPLREFVNWLADFNSDLVIEFVKRSDPMVQTLLRNKEDNYTDYEVPYFEQCLTSRYNINSQEEIGSGTRILYYCSPR